MALFTLPSSSVTAMPALCSWETGGVRGKPLILSYDYPPLYLRRRSGSVAKGRGLEVRAFFPNPTQQPILKEALKEPVAFVGGIFAGLLRLDLNEEPLREWVTRTVQACGITPEEISKGDVEQEEEVPQQIEIE